MQDDAVLYGVKIILKGESWSWENTFSGYKGWVKRGEDYGNHPIVVASRINYQPKNTIYFLQYQKEIQNFPYDQVRLGINLPLKSLTPHF